MNEKKRWKKGSEDKRYFICWHTCSRSAVVIFFFHNFLFSSSSSCFSYHLTMLDPHVRLIMWTECMFVEVWCICGSTTRAATSNHCTSSSKSLFITNSLGLVEKSVSVCFYKILNLHYRNTIPHMVVVVAVAFRSYEHWAQPLGDVYYNPSESRIMNGVK